MFYNFPMIFRWPPASVYFSGNLHPHISQENQETENLQKTVNSARQLSYLNTATTTQPSSQEWGLQGGEMGENNWGDLLFFLIRYCILKVLWGFNYSKTAN